MKNYIFLLLCVAGISAASCSRNTSSREEVENPTAYACPMQCEGDKTYTEAGKCPVCGMHLKGIESAVERNYSMLIRTESAALAAGQTAQISFRPLLDSDTSSLVPLDEVHDHKIHVVIVSADLSYYQHIHPVYQANGNYTVDFQFPAGGEYIIFSDYIPTGSQSQVDRQTFSVTGQPRAKQQFAEEKLSDVTNGYTLQLQPQNGNFLTNNLNHAGVTITKDGKAVQNLQPVMGALGHLVIISGDGQQYLHVHPNESEGKMDFHMQFTTAGIYRGFFQFQVDDVLQTAQFTIRVKEGAPGEIPDDHGDGSGEHSHEGHGSHSH